MRICFLVRSIVSSTSCLFHFVESCNFVDQLEIDSSFSSPSTWFYLYLCVSRVGLLKIFSRHSLHRMLHSLIG